ncbi:putative Elongin-C [Microthyrium microscopicum]|uniref:Elongin-C n=1 Tax=Microthyrium microscopicum TaxID=703497 RepID=A0A6A6U7T6_9PEZI|nr:putative Elongin-C [Microthyrium microscopicum]
MTMMEKEPQQPLSEWVTLISHDEFTFHILRSSANLSGTIRRMLDPKSGFKESVTGVCHFENISGTVLEKVCEYLYYKDRYQGMTNVPDLEIAPEVSLELALAADYLDCRAVACEGIMINVLI